MKALLLGALAAVVLVLVWYAAFGREWLKAKPWAEGFFAAIEPWEISLYKKSETILFARLKIVTGLLLSLLTMLGGIDMTAITPFVPSQHQGKVNLVVNLLPLAISLVGWLDEHLRNGTTKPLELVAVPDTKPVPVVVADAVEVAEVTKVVAVAVVKDEENKAEAEEKAKGRSDA